MDDLISKNKTIELLIERLRDTAFNNVGEEAAAVLVDVANNRLRRWLKELPTEKKTGKWIHCKYPLGECSECHKIINIQANEAIYCPCCGARMKEGGTE